MGRNEFDENPVDEELSNDGYEALEGVDDSDLDDGSDGSGDGTNGADESGGGSDGSGDGTNGTGDGTNGADESGNGKSSGKGKSSKKSKKSDKKLNSKKSVFDRFNKKESQIIRIEDLEQLMAENGGEIDPELIVSMYMPKRNARRIGAALLRMDKMRLALLGLMVVVAGLFILAFLQEKMGNFTINLNRLELYRKGIAISEDGEFSDPTARLTADAIKDATNITWTDLPDDLDADFQGNHNGRNYMAYTYYVRNAGKEDVSYRAYITLDSYAKGAEYAVRVAVWKNGKRVIYAEPSKTEVDEEGNALPEENCVNFVDHDTVCIYEEENFLVGNVDKYTIVIYMEGEDPDCIDTIVGGAVAFSMNIDAMDDDNTNLLVKFIQDIKDTLSDDKAISASGNEAPSYYQSGEVTWSNRRNQGEGFDEFGNPIEEDEGSTEGDGEAESGAETSEGN